MNRNELANFGSCCCACIGSCFNSTYITSYHNGNKTAANMNLTDKVYISCLYHCIGCFNRTNQTFCFYHSKCL